MIAKNLKESKTMANLETAFAGEAMAYIKYCYFAKLVRQMGDQQTALLFEATADQEFVHACAHLEMLYPKTRMTPATLLQIAIATETHDSIAMYPDFRNKAKMEYDALALAATQERAAEARLHAKEFQAILEKAHKRFAALTKVEAQHANQYRQQLQKSQHPA
jgi:rubrerythrin